MSKEVKKDEPKTSGTKYLIVGLVVILAGVYALLSNNSTNEQTVTIAKPTATTEQAPVAEQISVTEETPAETEPTVARIDITTPLVNADEPQFEVYVDGSKMPLKQSRWMIKHGYQGVMIQSDKNPIDITIKSEKEVSIEIALKGIRKQKDDILVKRWVKYSSFAINGEEILPNPISAWYGKAFKYQLKIESGKEYNLHTEWGVDIK